MRLIRYTNNYRCDGDGSHKLKEWSDDSSSTNNDECPVCHAEIEPEDSEEYDTDDSGKADIVVIIEDGLCERVVAPKGLSVLVLDRDVDSADGDDLVRDEDGKECVPTWFKEPGEANADEVVDSVRGLLREALEHQARSFETSDHVNGANMVEWFAEWRERARAALAAAPWEGAPAEPDWAKDAGRMAELVTEAAAFGITPQQLPVITGTPVLTSRGVSELISKKYGVEARAERCLLVMTGTDMGTITETDVTILECAARNDFYDIGDDETRVTWPAVWIKQEPQEQTGFWISTADDHLGQDPAALMVGASPWLRNLWRDARAAGFTRIELTWG